MRSRRGRSASRSGADGTVDGSAADDQTIGRQTVGGGPNTAVSQTRWKLYEASRRAASTEERAARVRRHLANHEWLAAQGELRLASGATLGAAVALLRAAVTPAASVAEHETKRFLLEDRLVASRLERHHGHVPGLVAAALRAEASSMADRGLQFGGAALADAPRLTAATCEGHPVEGGPSPSDRDAYADLVLLASDRAAMIDAMVRSLDDLIDLGRRGLPQCVEGARIALEDLDLTVCATSAQTVAAADDKARLLAGSHSFHRRRSPLVAAVIRATLDVEGALWGGLVLGTA